MATETTESTKQAIRAALGITDQTLLIESGNYESGFWHNELVVDLEQLLDGEIRAFHLIEDVHDTAGTSQRELNGLAQSAKLPNGVNNDAIVDLCAGIWERRDELTKGLTIEFVNGNWQAMWTDEDSCVCAAHEYWAETFREEVDGLGGREVYDLAHPENLEYVYEAVMDLLPADASVDAIEIIVSDAYITDAEMIYTGHSDFAEWLAYKIASEDE